MVRGTATMAPAAAITNPRRVITGSPHPSRRSRAYAAPAGRRREDGGPPPCRGEGTRFVPAEPLAGPGRRAARRERPHPRRPGAYGGSSLRSGHADSSVLEISLLMARDDARSRISRVVHLIAARVGCPAVLVARDALRGGVDAQGAQDLVAHHAEAVRNVR